MSPPASKESELSNSIPLNKKYLKVEIAECPTIDILLWTSRSNMSDSAKDQLKIKKPVQSLVLIPKKGKLSVVARKLYNVILHSTIAQIAEF
jgi:hypothetical protein